MNRIAKRTGSFKSFDGTRIYYEVRGQGKPLVLAYGIGCLINHWQHQIKYFSQNYQTIVFDYRGHHKSEVPADRSTLTIDSLARDLKALMDHLEINKASFWGHSFGVQVLVRAIDIYPEFFDNLVFVNGFANNPINGMFGTDAVAKVFESFKSSYDFLPETIGHVWRRLTSNPLAIQGLALAGGFNMNLTKLKDVEIYLRGLNSMDIDSFMAFFEDMMTYDGRNVFDRIEVPTLIISGDKDTVTPAHYQDEMNEKIRNSRFLKVPYGSHCTQLDMPDFVNLRIEKFLRAINYNQRTDVQDRTL